MSAQKAKKPASIAKQAKLRTLPAGSRGRPKGLGSQLAYEYLREQIIGLHMAPGEDINEAALQSELKMSRTPVREAIIRLSAEGLVVITSNVGARVAALHFDSVPPLLEAIDLCQRAMNRWSAIRHSPRHLDEMRHANDAFAAAIAAKDPAAITRTNTKFHTAIAASCGNDHIVRWYQFLSMDAERLSRIIFSRLSAIGRTSLTLIDQHLGMIEAISRRDVEEADRIMVEHANAFQLTVRQHFSQNLADKIVISGTSSLHLTETEHLQGNRSA